MIARTEIDKCYSTALNGRVSLNRPCEAGGTGAGAAQVGRQVRIGMRR